MLIFRNYQHPDDCFYTHSNGAHLTSSPFLIDSEILSSNFSVMNAGCCKVLLHPLWGSAVYPATLFTTAPAARVVELLNLLETGGFNEKLAFQLT